MKQFSLILLILSFASLKAQQDSSIMFQDIEYAELLDLAKKTNKPMMLYFHFDGCPPCAKMKKQVFTNPEVAAFYNSSFLNYSINTKKGSGIEVNKHYNIKLHPTFLYLNKEGEIIHKALGYISPEEFINTAKLSLEGGKTYSYMQNKYQENKSDPEVLYEYVNFLNDKHESSPSAILDYLKMQSIEDLGTEKNIKFIYDYCHHNFNYIVEFGSREFNFISKNKDLFAKYFDLEQVDARLIFIAENALNFALENRDSTKIFEIISFLENTIQKPVYKFKNQFGDEVGIIMTDAVVSNAKFNYFLSVGNKKMILETLDSFMTKNWNNDKFLNNIAWELYENETTDIDIITKATECAKRAVSLNASYYNLDTYAAIMYKSGNLKQAKKLAKKAIKIAKKEKIEYTETEKLLEKINR